MNQPMKILVIDIGGTHVKVLATGQETHREFVSGRTLTPKADGCQSPASWSRIGNTTSFPSATPAPSSTTGRCLDPWNLGNGWVGI